MKRVVLGLGTNLGDRRENLRAALAALSHLPKTEVENVSSVWQTAPFDVPDEQQDYWNICVLLKTELSPSAVLGACLGIEAAMGRVREIYHGARCMDLDVLLYEGFTQREKGAQCAAPRHFWSARSCCSRFWNCFRKRMRSASILRTHRALKTGTTCSASARRKKSWIDISNTEN